MRAAMEQQKHGCVRKRFAERALGLPEAGRGVSHLFIGSLWLPLAECRHLHMHAAGKSSCLPACPAASASEARRPGGRLRLKSTARI